MHRADKAATGDGAQDDGRGSQSPKDDLETVQFKVTPEIHIEQCLGKLSPPPPLDQHLTLVPPPSLSLLPHFCRQVGLTELIRVMGKFRELVDTVDVKRPWLTPGESEGRNPKP